jgi:hypothetical protein
MRLKFAQGFLGLVALAAIETSPACAQVRFDAQYTLSMAGIAIGKLTWQTRLGASDYTTVASGRVVGFLSLLVSGEGKVSVMGEIKDGRPQPVSFASMVVREDEKVSVQIGFDGSRVRELRVEEPPLEDDRVPIADAHKLGVTDPLSAFLIPGPADPTAREGCERTLAMFDGRRRYDLALAFKRTDVIKGAGDTRRAALVCSVKFTPISGHRTSSQLVKFLAEGRDIEVWLVPVTGTRILAPVRLSVASLIGNMVLQANAFETTALATPGK